MRLKRLIVKGFKSFADRTEFDFDVDLTGIVGPNGCGKSNVVDALKWVLGDQRAKSLRGDEMTDVIFKGAEGREAMQFAEVSVVLEDDAGDAAGPFAGRAEVTIGRRLTRDKESTYLLNGEPVRLKDVRDLLMDTGLGVGAYSVMEQGRIDAVLSANPESRRAIFEEAAGISKFKIQKREALRKLERTEQNLARVKDLLEERGRRIRGLKVQAGKARRWREIHGRLRDLRSAIAVHDARALRAEEHGRLDERTELEERLATAQAELAAARELLGGAEGRISDAEARLDAVQERLRAAVSKREAARHRAEGLEQRAEELRQDAEACVLRAGNVERQRDERRKGLEEARARLAALETELVELGRRAEERREASKAAQRRVQEFHAAREAARDAMLEEIHARTACRNRAHDQTATLRGIVARSERLQERSGLLEAERGARTEERSAIQSRLDGLGRRRAVLEREHARALAALEVADSEAAELAKLESGLRERLASTTSRLDVLQDLEAQSEGLDQGPRFLLEERPPGLRGRLVDQLEVDLEYSRALEAALGDYVQALVVETRGEAEAMLRRLADEGRGRATLLIAEEFGDRLQRTSVFSLPERCDFLYKKVRCRPEAWPMVQWLLRGVCLVETLTDAVPERTDLCFVTPDGTMVCGPRLAGGAGDEARSGLVVRRARIKRLSEEVVELEERLRALQGDIHEVEQRVGEGKERIRRVDGARQKLAARERTALDEQVRIDARLADVDRELEELAAERTDLSRERYAALGRLSDHLLEELLIRRRERRAQQRETEAEQALAEARREADTVAAEEQEGRVQQAARRSERDAQEHRITAFDEALRDLSEALAELDARREQALAGVAEAEAEAAQQRAASEALRGEIDVIEGERDTVAAQLGAEREARQELQDAVLAHERSRDDLREQLGQLRLVLQDVANRFARLEDRLRDETAVELRRLLGEVGGPGILSVELFGPPAPPDSVEVLLGPPLPEAFVEPERELRHLWLEPDFDLDAARQEAQVLKAQMERLGAVNLDAVRELEDEEARFGTLEQDVADLTEARKSLMEALRQMETESRQMFERTFEQARQNFQLIFRKLFQGGRADMYLAQEEDALDAGIEIVAKPPGKELQSIALLSGGERSLTALAILFAVFKVKPSPFCILDEVDAALDETNVERFLRVLNDFVGPSQFCIVTHHKRTMAECQKLYGITMQKRGVSTRIGVTLDEVDEFSEGPRYEKAAAQRIAGEEHIGF